MVLPPVVILVIGLLGWWILVGFRREGEAKATGAYAWSSPKSHMTVVRKLWLGGYSLPVAFWGFYVLGSAASFVLGAIILVFSYRLHLGTIGFIVSFVIFNGYWLTAAVGVWRSADLPFRSAIWMSRVWAIAARGVVILALARAAWWFMNGGAHILMQRMTAPMDF
jgi:hypothetical protein